MRAPAAAVVGLALAGCGEQAAAPAVAPPPEPFAVAAEERPRPSQWTRLLTQRYQDDELFTLEDINFGFIRPSDSNDDKKPARAIRHTKKSV